MQRIDCFVNQFFAFKSAFIIIIFILLYYIYHYLNMIKECDKWCDVWEYLDYANCKCRKRRTDKLVEECSENIDGVKKARITLAEDENKCKSSWTIYVILIVIIFTISIGSGTYLIFYKYINQKTTSRYDYVYQTTIY